jgi:hypothetical protein
MTGNNERCKGCLALTWARSVIRCSISIKDGKVCPCSICLVKSMCRDICEEFINFTALKFRSHIIKEIYD